MSIFTVCTHCGTTYQTLARSCPWCAEQAQRDREREHFKAVMAREAPRPEATPVAAKKPSVLELFK